MNTILELPKLEPHCGSWIASDDKGKAVCELFHAADALVMLHAGYTVETAAQYLARFNRSINN